MLNSKTQIEKIRLNKFLAKWAGVSRRSADILIKRKHVFINNVLVTQLASFVDPKKDVVRIKKKVISFKHIPLNYFMFNKPQKVISTNKDPEGRACIMDFIKQHKKQSLFSVGRLDWSSEGLLILTNDGEFANKVLHPKNKIAKTYLVKVQGRPRQSHIQKLVTGVTTSVGRKRALFAKIIKKEASSSQWVKIIISEGKKHQIRLMFEKISYPVLRLRRVAIGRLKMHGLNSGLSIKITDKEKDKVFQLPKELFKKF